MVIGSSRSKPILFWHQIQESFADTLSGGKLPLVGSAVAKQTGDIRLYPCEESVWGTVAPSWNERSEVRGGHSQRETAVDGGTPTDPWLGRGGVLFICNGHLDSDHKIERWLRKQSPTNAIAIT